MAGAGTNLTEEGLLDVPGFWSRWARLPNGARAHYMTSGGSGPAVVLLHGGEAGSSAAADWHLSAPLMGEGGLRVYCPDLSGFGLADTRPDFLDKKPKTHVDSLIAFADALCLDKFYLAGVGAGAMDAVKVAISNPERLLGIVFVAGAFGPAVDYSTRVLQGQGSFWPEASGYVSPAFDGGAASMEAIWRGLLRDDEALTPGLVAMSTLSANKQRAAREGVPESPQDFNAHDIVWQTKDRIEKLEMPMLCLYGLGSSWLPVENGFAQEDYIGNVQFFYPDGCGHHVPLDRPRLFSQLMLEFCRQGRVSWATALEAGVSLRRAPDAALVVESEGGFPAARPQIYESLEALRQGY